MITTTVRTPSFVARFRASPEIDIQKLIPEKEVFLGDAQKFMQAFDDLRAIHYPDEEIWIEMQASQNNRATGALGMWWHGGWNLVRKFNEYFQWWYRDPPKAKGVVTMVMTPAGKSAGALKVYHRKSWNPQVMGWESGGGHGSNHLRFYITTGAAGYTYGSKVLCEDVTGCKFDWFSFYPF